MKNFREPLVLQKHHTEQTTTYKRCHILATSLSRLNTASNSKRLFGEEIQRHTLHDTSSGDNSPDLEIIWFPFLAVEAGDKPPDGTSGLTGVSVRMMIAASV